MILQTNKPKILIVDVVASNLELVKVILQDKSYMSTYINDDQLAISQINNIKFDLILVNSIIDEMFSIKFCHRVADSSKNADTTVILLTEKPIEKMNVNGYKAGTIDYVRKPFSDQELLARVQLHLSLQKTREELKAAKAVAEEEAKARTMFLANMSHEIRTPLNGIVGMIDILSQSDLDSQQKDYVDIIGISTETLLMIINDILDFSKIDSGELNIERIKFNIRKEVNDVYKLLTYKANQKGLDFSLDIKDEVPELLWGDPLRIKQILINLVNNAIKFTENGFVHIQLGLDDTLGKDYKLKFEISDSGIGISEENQNKLFQTFSQANVSTYRKFGGTGLGLAISKRLSSLMQGEIGVESEEGKGAKFWFTIKVQGIDSIIGEVLSNVEGANGFNHLNILMAEDNEINQKVSMLNILKLGHKLKVANNGKTAVKMFENEKFDLILMDINMPDMDGVEAAMEIRRIEAESGVVNPVPIIATTANTYKDDVIGYRSAGMNDYLGKPFKPEDLEEIIRKNIGSKINSLVN